jgi:hypothetical protein
MHWKTLRCIVHSPLYKGWKKRKSAWLEYKKRLSMLWKTTPCYNNVIIRRVTTWHSDTRLAFMIVAPPRLHRIAPENFITHYSNYIYEHVRPLYTQTFHGESHGSWCFDDSDGENVTRNGYACKCFSRVYS